MDHKEFRAFLNLLMCSDPWPTDDEEQQILTDLADEQSRNRGFENWIVAYHEFMK